jgi:hypothetical protein
VSASHCALWRAGFRLFLEISVAVSQASIGDIVVLTPQTPSNLMSSYSHDSMLTALFTIHVLSVANAPSATSPQQDDHRSPSFAGSNNFNGKPFMVQSVLTLHGFPPPFQVEPTKLGTASWLNMPGKAAREPYEEEVLGVAREMSPAAADPPGATLIVSGIKPPAGRYKVSPLRQSPMARGRAPSSYVFLLNKPALGGHGPAPSRPCVYEMVLDPLTVSEVHGPLLFFHLAFAPIR